MLTATPGAEDEEYGVDIEARRARKNNHVEFPLADKFSEKTTSTTETKSPCGNITIKITCEWGKRNGKWHFISMITNRLRNGEEGGRLPSPA